MEYVTLSNGVKMPQLGYGVYQVTREECERCVSDALEVGYRHIDTAQSYFNEQEVGNAVKKIGHPPRRTLYHHQGVDRALRPRRVQKVRPAIAAKIAARLYRPRSSSPAVFRLLRRVARSGRAVCRRQAARDRRFQLLARQTGRFVQLFAHKAHGQSGGNAPAQPAEDRA